MKQKNSQFGGKWIDESQDFKHWDKDGNFHRVRIIDQGPSCADRYVVKSDRDTVMFGPDRNAAFRAYNEKISEVGIT